MVTTTWSQTAGMTSETGTDNIEDYAEQAEASKVAAAASETAAASSATASASSASGSSTSAAEALASKNAAAVSEANAAASAATAATQASNSSTSATASETSKVAAVAAQAAAETAETAAETAQTAAEAAEAGVAADAATATAQAAIATTQATSSGTSATASEASRVAAVAAQAAAETAETNAETAEANAETAEANAAASASTATTKASEAVTSALNASTSASTATTKASEASASASSASASEASASSSATSAANSASTATTKASEASTSASNAAASEAAAETAETNAETAETNAQTAQTAAEAAEVNAASSSASASTSAATATTQAGISTTKAGEAAASATASASSATASEAAKDAALSALDNFQDQYLGDFATDPTTDNDGDPLQAGMLYFNTTDDVMKVYTGSAWVAAYASLSGALLTSNNLSDLVNVPAARTNLGLGTAATTASTDYATAAQGTLADSAVQPSDSPTFGSVTVTGTVDGRDVAADGTKLDGIEAAADVTDTTNVTAAGALMDSEVTNLAQVKAFSSLDYATAAQGTLADSAVQPNDSPVFGSVTVTGTVDGRDVAADGTKLDGIEAGATADQTKADIDALGIEASTASALATARNIAVTGAVTGNANFDGSGNISISTTATADPTLTLSGDASGSATFTNLGNATLSVTVADDSHNHVISNVDGLQTALDGKLSTSGKAADSNLLDGIDSSAFLRSNAGDNFTGDLTTANNHITFGPNSTWSSYLRVGGNGRTVSGAVSASVVTTNGNLHLDSGTDKATYLNYYAGTAGTYFGNGNDGIVAVMGSDGDLWKGSSDNSGSRYWHAGNDGSGSGLDADTVDGFNSSQTEGANTVAVRSSAGYLFSSYFNGSGTFSTTGATSGMARFTGTNGTDTYGRSYTAAAARTLLNVADGANRVVNNNQLTNGAGYTTYTANQAVNTSSSPSFSAISISGIISGQGDAAIGGGSGYGYFKGYDLNWNHFIGSRMQVSGSTASPTISGGHDLTFVEYLNTDSDGFKFKNSSTGSYVDVAHITRNGMFLYDGSLREDYDALSGTSPTCNVNNGGAFSLTMSGNTTFTFSGATSGMSSGFILQLTGNGSTVTWPSSVDWAGGAAPDAPASGESNLYVFYSRDGGSNWIGVLSSAAYA